MKNLTLLVVLLCVPVIAAQSGSPQPPTGTQNVDAAIKAVADQYTKATLAGDAKAIAALYTDDAVEMPPNEPPVKGRAAIQQFYEKQFKGGKMSRFTLNHLETRGIGDAGYDVGTYQQSMTPTGGAAMEDSGKYVVILKRSGGSWRVAYAIYNSDQPPPPAK